MRVVSLIHAPLDLPFRTTNQIDPCLCRSDYSSGLLGTGEEVGMTTTGPGVRD